MYKDVTKELEWEPLLKTDGLLHNRVYHKGKLVATIDNWGRTQRQAGKQYLVFWERGTFHVLEAHMEVV